MAYQPAVNTTLSPGMTQLATVYYKKVGLTALRAKLRFHGAMMPDDIPLRSGKTAQWWRPVVLTYDTTPAAEGVVGVGIPLTATTYTGTVSEYANFTSVSTLLLETAINNMIEMACKEMSYMAALTVDTIDRLAIEGAGATIQTPIGSYLSLNDVRKQAKLLEGLNVPPLNGGPDYYWITSPWNVYDIQTDSSAGGFLDVSKYTSNVGMSGTLSGAEAFPGEVGKAAGARIVSTSVVGTDGVAAPNTKYYNYIVGEGAFGGLALMGRGPSDIIDPEKQTFKLNVIAGGPSPADPPGEIGTYIAYRFVYAAVSLNDSSAYRYAIVKADSSII